MTAIRLSVFLLLVATATAQDSAASSSANSLQPDIPVASESTCPGKGRVVPNWKITHSSPVYSSLQDHHSQITTLAPGDIVTVVAGLVVVRHPDKILVTQPIPGLHLVPGDVILRYNRFGEGLADILANGIWHDKYDASFTTEKSGLGCRKHCWAEVIERGVREWWVQVKTRNGETGWVLDTKVSRGEPWDSGNFHDLCAEPDSD